jgi:predicted RND superfamily exporter protein
LQEAQVRRPGWTLAVGFLVAALGALLASRLELRTRFEQLLPETQPSVIELARLEQRVSGQQNVFIVLEGAEPATLRSLGDALVPELRALGHPWVASADDGVQEARAFLRPRTLMFLDRPSLASLHDDVEARWDWEVSHAMGTDLDDDPPPAIDAESIRRRLHVAEGERFPDGYYQSKDGTAVVVVIRSGIGPGNLDGARQTLERIEGVVARIAHGRPFEGVHIGFAGDLVTGLAEYGAVRDDLLKVGVLGVAAVLAVILVFFMRLRVLAAMGITIAVGLAETFGVTQLAIGHLNVATGFLISIVAGNGINFGIILMARFYEEIRGGASTEVAIAIARASTWRPTLTAALAAAASYGSLGVTEFRAFKHFAFIGAAGMLLCWVATFTVLPAVIVVFERARPSIRTGGGAWGRLRWQGARYERPFSWMVARAPRTVAVVGAAAAVVGLALTGPYLRSDPMEYDMRRLQNDLGDARELYRTAARATDVLGIGLDDAMVLLCDRADQVPQLTKALEANRDAASDRDRPFGEVHALTDYVPDEQDAKLPVVMALRERLLRARERGFVKDADWVEIEPLLPPADLARWTIDDLPGAIARPFTERDGTRGRLVLIEPAKGRTDADLHYLMQWADSLRETRLGDGSVVRGSGRPVIFADILEAVRRDMPRALTLSFALTVAAVIVSFGFSNRSAAIIASLGVALGWIAAVVCLTGLKVNFFNFVAIPVTFGIGVDYAVNVMQRYEADRRAGILDALRHVGGPVVLCSLTTMLGYLALVRSSNRAIRSLGLWAVLGEVACLGAAVLVLPAVVVWARRNRQRMDPVTALGVGADDPNDGKVGP